MHERLDWSTTHIFPDGTQRVHIHPMPSKAPDETVDLNHPQSQLLLAVPAQIANETAIPWSTARQAVLRAFWNTIRTP